MKEFLEAVVSPANFLPTLLFVFIMLYWLTVIFGAVGSDFLDFDLETDVDADADMDMDADSGEGKVDVSWLNAILRFFNLGKVPFMVWLTFVILPLWGGSVYVNDLIGNSSFLLYLVLFIPLLIGSVFVAKILTQPFIKVFEALDKDMDEDTDPVGKVCTLLMQADSERSSQAEIHINGNSLMVYVRTRKDVLLQKGATALVIERSPDQKYYVIEPYAHDYQ